MGYSHVDLRRLAFRTLFEAVTDAFTKESEQQVDSTMALTICENKVTFSERSYAHCSMSIYMHPRTFDPFLGDESRSLPVGIYIHRAVSIAPLTEGYLVFAVSECHC